MSYINDYSNNIINTINSIAKAMEKIDIEKINSIYSIIERYSNALVKKADYSRIDSISRVIDQLSSFMKKYCLEDSTQSDVEKNDENISDEIEKIITEMPVDETIKEEIVSSEEFKALKKKERWTKDYKIAVASFIFSILSFLYDKLPFPGNSESESTTNNITVNITNYNETKNEHIEQLESTQAQLEEIFKSIFETIEIDETKDISNSSDSDALTFEVQ